MPGKLYLDHLSEYEVVSIDCETTGLHWYKDKVFGIAVSAWSPGEPIASAYYDIRERPNILNVLRGEAPKIKKYVNHHAKFDLHMLANEGIHISPAAVECTRVRAALIDEHEHSYDLDFLAKRHVGKGKVVEAYDELASLFGGKADRRTQMPNLQRAPERIAAKYAVVDPELAILLWQWQEEEIERQDLHQIWGLEREFTPVLFDIERQGIRVDGDLTQKRLKEIEVKIAAAQRELNKVAGKDFNANSTPQMRALFGCRKGDEQAGENPKKWYTSAGIQLISTDADGPSLDKDAMEIIGRLGDTRAQAVLTYRKLTKAKQFLANHILGHMVGEFIYPHYNQLKSDDGGTITGRESIEDPAMQQIPSRDKDVAALVRSCFLPRKGERWGCADWEQFEFRWFAHYTNDANILEAYNVDPRTDFHSIVSKITGIPRNPPYAGAANAKQINLGLVFGMGEGTMAYEMGLDYTDRVDDRGREWRNAGPKAKEVFAKYHGAIPGVKQLTEKASSIARARGFVKTVMGRHIRFPGGKFVHTAAGLVFQGTSADCLKYKKIQLYKLGKKHGFGYILSVHDENNTSLPPKHEQEFVQIIKKELELFDGKDCPIECRVPILSSIKTGANWWEASKKD